MFRVIVFFPFLVCRVLVCSSLPFISQIDRFMVVSFSVVKVAVMWSFAGFGVMFKSSLLFLCK